MADRREQILSAAELIASEQGWDALSVRAVAARAQLGASTLRYYFPTQRDLYDALVCRTLRSQFDDLRIHDASVPARERLAECVGQFLPHGEDAHVQLEAVGAAYAVALGPTRTEQGAHLLEVMGRQGRAQIESWIQALVEEGAIGADTDPRRLATVLLSLVDGLCLEMIWPGAELTPAEARSLFADAVGRLVDDAG